MFRSSVEMLPCCQVAEYVPDVTPRMSNSRYGVYTLYGVTGGPPSSYSANRIRLTPIRESGLPIVKELRKSSYVTQCYHLTLICLSAARLGHPPSQMSI
jgi:hypothetical protein